MLNTYIKNRGFTKTIIHNSKSKKKSNNTVNELKWDADYDGDLANISFTSNTNGHKKHFDISLDNNDLENILNVPSVDMPIHQRLQMDFSEPRVAAVQQPIIYKIEIPQIETPKLLPIEPNFKNKYEPDLEDLKQILSSSKPKRYLSTPLSDEELFFPMSINKRTFNSTMRNHKRSKSHKTYRVYKKHKSSTHSKSHGKSYRKGNRKSQELLF